MPRNNPFFHRGPIHRPEHFHNRKAEVERCLHLLKKGQSVSVIGPRKIGKTSLLLYITHPEVFTAYGLREDEHLLIYLDCAGLHGLTGQDLYELILDEVNEKLREQGIQMALQIEDERTAYLDFVRAIKAITKKRRLILIFDEFEGFSSNLHLDSDFFAGLRALSVKHKVAFVTASKTPLVELTMARADSLLSSNFFNIFSNLYLQLFDCEDGRLLLQNSLAPTEVTFSPETTEWVLQVSGCHPFFLQIAGDCAYEMYVANGQIPETADYGQMEHCLEKEARGHFQYYWQGLSGADQYVLKALPQIINENRHRETIVHLREQCLIVKRGTNLDYFSPLFGQYVARQMTDGWLEVGPLSVDRQRRAVFVRGQRLELTDLNYKLLLYLMEHEGRTIGREELDREVWHPTEVAGSEERVKAGIKSLRQALGNEKRVIVSRWGKGYTFLRNPPD